MLYRSLAKPLLFKMDPEQAHHLIIGGLSGVGSIRPVPSGLRVMYGVRETSDLAVDMFGCHFPTPVGLAAGLDKNG
ncbi:dihydroorotate dehydrogenase (quinone), partial [Clostridioides difficile]